MENLIYRLASRLQVNMLRSIYATKKDIFYLRKIAKMYKTLLKFFFTDLKYICEICIFVKKKVYI